VKLSSSTSLPVRLPSAILDRIWAANPAETTGRDLWCIALADEHSGESSSAIPASLKFEIGADAYEVAASVPGSGTRPAYPRLLSFGTMSMIGSGGARALGEYQVLRFCSQPIANYLAADIRESEVQELVTLDFGDFQTIGVRVPASAIRVQQPFDEVVITWTKDDHTAAMAAQRFSESVYADP